VGFFSPWFLLGSLAVGLPVWLHLLRQYRHKPLPFSSVMFFERRLQSSDKHRRLRYLLLLALRAAILILLALAFANPFIKRNVGAASSRKLVVIAVDRSFSMRYGDRISQAKLLAYQALGRLRGGELAEVVAVDSHVESLTPPSMDAGTLSAAIDSIQPNDRASSFGEFVRGLRAMQQNTGMSLDVKFIGDMQRTAMPSKFSDVALAPHTALDLLPVARGKTPNWAVETVSAPVHVYDPRNTRVTATISGWQTGPAPRKVSFLLDGRPIASKDVNVPENGRAQAEFLSFDVPYGFHRGEIRIEPHDGLPQDDSFPLSIERSDPRKVLFLYQGGRNRGAFYYRTALESASDTGLTVQPAPVEQASKNDFAKHAFVVLDDIGGLDQALEQRLSDYVHKGGALLICVGENTARNGRLPVTGSRFEIVSRTQGAGSVDNQSAAMRGAGQWENVRFFATARLDLKPGDRVLAKFADGSPLLIEQHWGEGRILTFASGLDNLTNDFPLHTSFVPFVAQTGRYLAGMEETTVNMTAGAPVELRSSGDRGTAADVIGPGGKHELSLSDATKAVSFELDQDGFYEVQRADGRRVQLAVHADRRESDLTPLPSDTLALWRNTGSPASTPQTAGAQETTERWNLWRYVLILALAAAVAESLLGNKYLKEEGHAA
jgi:hypothetical protein